MDAIIVSVKLEAGMLIGATTSTLGRQPDMHRKTAIMAAKCT
jgi:hypothetical protein